MRTVIYAVLIAIMPAAAAERHADIVRAEQLYAAGDLYGAERLLREILSNPEAAARDPRVAFLHSDLGVIYQDLGRTADAERSYLKARALLEHHRGTPDGEMLWIRSLNNLVSLYLETGRYGPGERIVQELAKLRLPDGPDATRILGNIAGVHMVRGRHKEAETLFQEVYERQMKTGNILEAAVALNNLGTLAMERKDRATAVSRLARAMDLWKEGGVNDHPVYLPTFTNYGYALLEAGDGERAADVLGQALALAKRWHGDRSPVTAQVGMHYAAALSATGRKREAKEIKADAARARSAFAASDPARHTVDVLDFGRRR
jgi:tetratricopeptide (TPR) repeat protein